LSFEFSDRDVLALLLPITLFPQSITLFFSLSVLNTPDPKLASDPRFL